MYVYNKCLQNYKLLTELFIYSYKYKVHTIENKLYLNLNLFFSLIYLQIYLLTLSIILFWNNLFYIILSANIFLKVFYLETTFFFIILSANTCICFTFFYLQIYILCLTFFYLEIPLLQKKNLKITFIYIIISWNIFSTCKLSSKHFRHTDTISLLQTQDINHNTYLLKSRDQLHTTWINWSSLIKSLFIQVHRTKRISVMSHITFLASIIYKLRDS